MKRSKGAGRFVLGIAMFLSLLLLVSHFAFSGWNDLNLPVQQSIVFDDLGTGDWKFIDTSANTLDASDYIHYHSEAVYWRGDGYFKTNYMEVVSYATSASFRALGDIRAYPRTEAELKALTPPIAGAIYYDSDNAAVVVSTGTGAGAFGLITDGTSLPTGW